MQSGQAWGRVVENCCVLGAGRSPLQRSRSDVSEAERESFCTSTRCGTRDPRALDPSLFALCPLPPLPNRLKPKLALAAAGTGGSRLWVAPGWERGAPPLGQKGTLADSGWRTSGGLLGHFHTGRQCSSSLLSSTADGSFL